LPFRKFKSIFYRNALLQLPVYEEFMGLTRWKFGWRIGLLLLFCLIVFYLKNYDIAVQDFEKVGWPSFLYFYSRFFLFLFIFIACISLGELVLAHLTPKADLASDFNSNFILFFFSGASILNLLGAFFGVFGWLKFPLVLCIFLFLIFRSPLDLWSIFLKKLFKSSITQTSLKSKLHFFLISVLLILILFIVFSNGLFPAFNFNDVYEHYFHYYRAVLRDGHSGPNEAWFRFYETKGVGLVFLTNILSDFTGAQLVSLCYILTTALIVYKFCFEAVENTLWSILSVILFLGGILSLEHSSGIFFKLQIGILSNLAFICYVCIEILRHQWSELETKKWFYGGYFACLHFGYAYPHPTTIPALFLISVLAATYLNKKWRARFYFILLLEIALAVGLFSSLIVNYLKTGFFELFPQNFIWQHDIGNKEKFIRTFGTSGIYYTLALNMEQAIIKQTIWVWMGECFRSDYFTKVFLFLKPVSNILPIIMVIAFSVLGKKRNQEFFIVTALFILASCFWLLPFQIPSISRLFVFTLFFSAIGITTAVKICLDWVFKRMVFRWARFFQQAFLTIIVALILIQIMFNFPIRRLKNILLYASGQISYSNALTTHFYRNDFQEFEIWKKMKKILGYNTKLYWMTYFPFPAFSFPGNGAFTEPAYTLGPGENHFTAMFGEPLETKKIFQELNVNYFAIALNGKRPFDNPLIYTKLFHPNEINNYFEVVFNEDGYAVITWKNNGKTTPLSKSMIEAYTREWKKAYGHGRFATMYADPHRALKILK